jgi:hypothetical protein
MTTSQSMTNMVPFDLMTVTIQDHRAAPIRQMFRKHMIMKYEIRKSTATSARQRPGVDVE